MGTAVVTGAAGGIGRALAERLAAEGHHVHLADVAPTVDVAASLDGVPHVVDVASLAGLVTFPGGGVYAATKHAVVALAEQTALCLAGTQVSVTVLCPALVRTGMSAEDPADVATAALAAARSDRFLVAPDEWRPAISTRTQHLLSGGVPPVPAPDSTHHDRSSS